MAVYASFFLVIYVVGLPVFILCTLWRYSKLLKHTRKVPDSLLLGFLLGKSGPFVSKIHCLRRRVPSVDDYKLLMPAVLWEFVEILRKLFLSVIGSFWSSKSPMALATGIFSCLCHETY